MDATSARPAGAPGLRDLPPGAIGRALRLGWGDFRRKPATGLAVGALCVLGGWLLYAALGQAELVWLAIPVTAGFPLVGPFLAVGLYEVSRRLEAGQAEWPRGAILGVIWRQRLGQLPSMAWVIIVYFLFWSFFAHMLFALFLGPSALIDVTGSYAFLLRPEGLRLLVTGTVIGAGFALVLFSLSVVALPLLLDREVDFVTAMITSVAVVRRNPRVMLGWAATIAGLTFVAMLPALAGLVVVMPVLGHASWHMYRMAILPEG